MNKRGTCANAQIFDNYFQNMISRKRSQAYLIATVVIVGILVGFTFLSDYEKQDSSPIVSHLKKQLETESEKVLNYGFYNNKNMDVLVEDFAEDFDKIVGENAEVYFIAGENDSMNVYYFDSVKNDIDCNQDGNSLEFNANEVAYSCEIREGYNFYFIIEQEIGEENYIEISDSCVGLNYSGACIPSCYGKECGNNGCGGNCGECGSGESCLENFCVRDNLLDYLTLFVPFNGTSLEYDSPYSLSISNHGATYTNEAKIDGAYEFIAAEQDIITIGDEDFLSGGDGTTLTVSAWIKTDSLGGTLDLLNPIITNYFTNGKYKEWGLGIVNDKLFFGAADDNDWDSNGGLQGSTALTTTKWYHVAFTQDDQDIKIYLDGEIENSTTLPFDTPDESGSVDIGSAYMGPRTYYDGKIDELRIYEAALTQGEIRYLIELDGGL